jgi:CBS-domain-containing membrane protein
VRNYQPLDLHVLAAGGACALTEPPSAPVTLESPAIEVMTDLARVPPAAIDPSTPLEFANSYMRARGVRSLFVVAADGNVQGLVTATDILGERPVSIGQARGVKRGDLRVSDVMTPAGAVMAFSLRDVMAAKVGHIVASLRQAGRHHALVGESLRGGGERIRGIFSATQIARQLGEPLHIAELATTFAEVEQALAAR